MRPQWHEHDAASENNILGEYLVQDLNQSIYNKLYSQLIILLTLVGRCFERMDEGLCIGGHIYVQWQQQFF